MKWKTHLGKVLVVATCLWPLTLQGDQIEREAREATNAPGGVLVRIDPVNKTVRVFKVDKSKQEIVKQNATRQQQEEAIRQTESHGDELAEFVLKNKELDKDSSTEAWYYGWRRSGWGWYGWGGYRPYYYNWYRPYYYPGYFNYGYYSYPYRSYYPYGNYYYSWYY